MDNISDSLKAKIQICLTRGIDFIPCDKNNQMSDIINIINDILDSPELLKQFDGKVQFFYFYSTLTSESVETAYQAANNFQP